MVIRPLSPRSLIGALLGIALLFIAFFSSRRIESLLGSVLQGSELLQTQVQSDFDRDGDVDFLDFTVFSAFYNEEASI